MSQDQPTGQPVDPREEKRVVTETTVTPSAPVKETVTESTETVVEPVAPTQE